MTECEEPGCARPATKSYKGRKVCDDCNDKYREQEEQRAMEMDF